MLKNIFPIILFFSCFSFSSLAFGDWKTARADAQAAKDSASDYATNAYNQALDALAEKDNAEMAQMMCFNEDLLTIGNGYMQTGDNRMLIADFFFAGGNTEYGLGEMAITQGDAKLMRDPPDTAGAEKEYNDAKSKFQEAKTKYLESGCYCYDALVAYGNARDTYLGL